MNLPLHGGGADFALAGSDEWNGMKWNGVGGRIAFRLVPCVAAERRAIWNSISRNNAATMRAVSLSCLARQSEKIEIEAL